MLSMGLYRAATGLTCTCTYSIALRCIHNVAPYSTLPLPQILRQLMAEGAPKSSPPSASSSGTQPTQSSRTVNILDLGEGEGATNGQQAEETEPQEVRITCTTVFSSSLSLIPGPSLSS